MGHRETVKYIDGTEVEVEVDRIGFRKANQIAKKHIPINNLTFNKDDTVTIKGDMDLIGMTESCLILVKGLDLDKLETSEASRLFNKYFKNDVMASMGQGSNPN